MNLIRIVLIILAFIIAMWVPIMIRTYEVDKPRTIETDTNCKYFFLKKVTNGYE